MHEVETRPVSGPPFHRLLVLVVLTVFLVAGGAVVFASGPRTSSGVLPLSGLTSTPDPNASTNPSATAAPSNSTDAAATQTPDASQGPGKARNGGWRFLGRLGGLRGRGQFGLGSGLSMDGRHAIRVSGIAGAQLALETDDGWTRTIDATGATITKDGKTITTADLKVGDTIRFAETHNADGTYTVTDIAVVLPELTGTVTAVTDQTITLAHPDGSASILHVDGGTTYQIPGADSAALADVKVGNLVAARGTLRDDNSLDATQVWIFNGQFRDRGGRRPWGPPGNDGGADDNSSPGASAAPNG